MQPDTFRKGAWRNKTKTQQSGHTPSTELTLTEQTDGIDYDGEPDRPQLSCVRSNAKAEHVNKTISKAKVEFIAEKIGSLPNPATAADPRSFVLRSV